MPRKPSRRVWFAESRGYALRRARTQARRAHDKPVVLTCDIDLSLWRDRLGKRRVTRRGGVIAIDGPVPVTVLRSHPAFDQPRSPRELAAWLNRLMGLKRHQAIHPGHPGVQRLSRWIERRLVHKPNSHISPGELLDVARRWLPDEVPPDAVDLDRLDVYPEFEQPRSAEELAAWINDVLGLKRHKGVSPHHPGMQRLVGWVQHRLMRRPSRGIAPGEILHLARQWLPDHFRNVEIDLDRLRTYRRVDLIDVRVPGPSADLMPREEEALRCLESTTPKRRIRGLKLLAEVGAPDLLDWCEMHLADESRDVRVAALRTMLRCDVADAELVAPLTASKGKRIRAAAIAVLAKHGGRDAPAWFKRGLKDPSACVRQETSALLPLLDPGEDRSVFELALNDPNPQIARAARKLTAGRGYAQARPSSAQGIGRSS